MAGFTTLSFCTIFDSGSTVQDGENFNLIFRMPTKVMISQTSVKEETWQVVCRIVHKSMLETRCDNEHPLKFY